MSKLWLQGLAAGSHPADRRNDIVVRRLRRRRGQLWWRRRFDLRRWLGGRWWSREELLNQSDELGTTALWSGHCRPLAHRRITISSGDISHALREDLGPAASPSRSVRRAPEEGIPGS